MKLSQLLFTRRNVIAVFLIVIASVFLLPFPALVQSAAPQQTRRTFENRIPSHVPLKVMMKKEKEEKALEAGFALT